MNEADAGFSLYVELGQLDTRDGSPQAAAIQSLREHYEWRCMGEQPIPFGLSDEDSARERVLDTIRSRASSLRPGTTLTVERHGDESANFTITLDSPMVSLFD